MSTSTSVSDFLQIPTYAPLVCLSKVGTHGKLYFLKKSSLYSKTIMWAASSVSDARYEYKIHSSVWITEPCKVKRHNKNKRAFLFRVGEVPPKMRSTKSTYFTNNWERYNFRKLNDLSLSLEWRIRSRLFLYLFRSWVNHKAGNHNFLSIKVTHSSDPESYTLLNRMLLSSGPRVHFLPAACASRSVLQWCSQRLTFPLFARVTALKTTATAQTIMYVQL